MSHSTYIQEAFIPYLGCDSALSKDRVAPHTSGTWSERLYCYRLTKGWNDAFAQDCVWLSLALYKPPLTSGLGDVDCPVFNR